MPKICPKCNSQIDDTANFCQQCGHPLIVELLTGKPLNPAWIVAMQEKIKDARRSEIIGGVVSAIGGVLTLLIVVPHLALHMQWETMDWGVVIFGLILFIVGGLQNDSSGKQKEKLINQLEKGK